MGCISLWRLGATLSLRCVGARYGGVSCCTSSRCTGFSSSCSQALGRRKRVILIPPISLEAGHKLPRGERVPCSLCIRGWRWCPQTVCWESHGDQGLSASPSCRWDGYLSGICLLELAPSILLLITWAFMVGDDAQPGSSGVHCTYQ